MSPTLFAALLFLSLLTPSLFPSPVWASRVFPINPSFHAENTRGTWETFARLAGAQRGSHFVGMSELKRYLHRFGYLVPNHRNGSLGFDFSDVFDESLETAVYRYQSSHGIPVTGKLDAMTLGQIMTPRCGVDDQNMLLGINNFRRYSFFDGRPSWKRSSSSPMNLTFAFLSTNFIDYVSPSEVKDAFRRAFARWADVIPVKFVEVKEYSKANIKIGFYGGDHGDGEPFDGVLGVLAHAFSPENGKLHLDVAERWAVDFKKETSSVAVDIESVATHEIGHILGLAHSSVKGAIMYPSLGARKKKVDLTIDDVEGVQRLYGPNPDFSLSSLVSGQTPSSPRIAGCLWAVSVALYATFF